MTASGAERMLLHVAIRSVDVIFLLHLHLGIFTTCTATTGKMQMTTEVIKLLRSDYCLRITIAIISIYTGSFADIFRFIPQTARCIAKFR
jgi:hypothetical protein